MKPYDIIFFIVLSLFIIKRRERHMVVAGIICLLLSAVNFALLVSFRDTSAVLPYIGVGSIRISFETAQHLIWYAAGFFLTAVVFSLWKMRNK